MPDSAVIAPQISLVRKLDLAEDEGRYIAGYANIADIVDSQNEVVTREALKAAWIKFTEDPEFAISMLMHSNIPLAKIVLEPVTDSDGNVHRSGVDDRGLYIVARVREGVTIADEIWEQIERGEYRGFSIGGRNLNPQPQICDEDRCYSMIKDLELYEVSIVRRPANRVSLFNILKGENMNQELFTLSKVTNEFKDMVLRPGVVKVSKTRGEDCGKYHVLLEGYPWSAERFESEDTRVVYEKTGGMKYIPLFDLALLRPLSIGEDLARKAGNVGSDPLPLSDKPPSGEVNPLKEQEVEKEEKSLPSDSETSKTEEEEEQVDEEEKEENEEEATAMAPLTLETLTAELAQLNERLKTYEDVFGEFNKEELIAKPFAGYKDFNACVRSVSARAKPPRDPKAYCAAIMHQVEGTKKSEESETPVINVGESVPAEVPVEAEVTEPAVVPEATPELTPSELAPEATLEPVVEPASPPAVEQPTAEPEPAPAPPVEQPAPTAKPVTQPEPEFRGRVVEQESTPRNLDLPGIYLAVSWKDLARLDKR